MDTDALLASALSTGREFLLLTLRVLPYLVIGAIAGALLQTPLARKWSSRVLTGGGPRPLLTAMGLAAILPGCSCATMPMAAGIKGAAAPRLGTITAFIFMSPLLSPITVALTWAMLGWPMTLARTVASFAGSFLIGLLVNRLEPWLTVPAPAPTSAEPACGCGKEGCSVIRPENVGSAFWPSLWSILRGVTPYFLLGMLVAALLSVVVPENAIPRYLGGASGVWAYAAAALVGVPLYVCEGEEVPITYALLSRGLGVGPSLTFLLGSVGTCVPTMLMARGIIGARATALYATFWLLFSVGVGALFQFGLAAHA